jgi:drug/metabolite transporter (DMT)-like permease
VIKEFRKHYSAGKSIMPQTSFVNNSQIKRGILYMLSATFIFMGLNLIVKDTSSRYSVFQVVFMRNLFAFFVFIGIGIFQGSLKQSFQSTQKVSHFIRGTLGVISLSCLFYGYKTMPIADATALTFATTLFMAVFSGPMLGERLAPARWIAIIIGFGGVCVMANPSGDLFHIGALGCLFYAGLDAYLCLKGRFLSRTDSPLTLTLYFGLFSILASSLTLPFVWVTPTNADLLSFILMGGAGGYGQYLLTQAYKNAPASVVGPMVYSAMIWGVLLGYIAHGHIPEIHIWIGSFIVIASGLYIIYSETKASVQTTPEEEVVELKKAA